MTSPQAWAASSRDGGISASASLRGFARVASPRLRPHKTFSLELRKVAKATRRCSRRNRVEYRRGLRAKEQASWEYGAYPLPPYVFRRNERGAAPHRDSPDPS